MKKIHTFVKFFGLDKIKRLYDMVKLYGGLSNALYKYWRNDDLKLGKLVGMDEFGHKYYENKRYPIGKSRWVDYSYSVGYDYDGSQVSPNWHAWLHYMTDHLPSAQPAKYKWMKKYNENLTGTRNAYVPYSTTKSKIYSWKPLK